MRRLIELYQPKKTWRLSNAIGVVALALIMLLGSALNPVYAQSSTQLIEQDMEEVDVSFFVRKSGHGSVTIYPCAGCTERSFVLRVTPETVILLNDESIPIEKVMRKRGINSTIFYRAEENILTRVMIFGSLD